MWSNFAEIEGEANQAIIVDRMRIDAFENELSRKSVSSAFGTAGFIWLCLIVVSCSFSAPALAQSQPVPEVQGADEQVYGNISGTVVDVSGAAVAGAQIKLTSGNQPPEQEILSGENGQFSFDDVVPGPIELTITAAGFATQKISRVLHPGDFDIVPQITLTVAANVTEVRVSVPRTEIAETQIKEQEKQLVLGFMPNFYVSYVPDAVHLDAKLKYQLAWKTLVNPFTLAWTAGIAGIEQADKQFPGYGQGAQGYAKRYGAAFADNVSGTMIGAAILPAILKQDPRYFYKGTGSTRSRILYAIASSVRCKGDNGR